MGAVSACTTPTALHDQLEYVLGDDDGEIVFCLF